jgi:hypothetical protein
MRERFRRRQQRRQYANIFWRVLRQYKAVDGKVLP